MAWRELQINDIRTLLSEDELQKLEEVSTELDSTISATIAECSDAFRGAFMGKGLEVDPRDHYVPDNYRLFILAFVRYVLWSRFPQSEQYALTEPRKVMYEKAVELLHNPYISPEPVDWEDPEISGDVDFGGNSSIYVPVLKMDDDLVFSSNWKPQTI